MAKRLSVVAVVIVIVVLTLVIASGHRGAKPIPRISSRNVESAHSKILHPNRTPQAEPTVTIAAVGDTELGNTPNLPTDPSTYLSAVEGSLAAPIVFGNLEGTITNSTTSKCFSGLPECYAFRVPTSYAEVMRQAGFNVLNSANNHSYDFGSQGVFDTTAALHAAGIVQAGLPGQIGIVSDNGIKVAFVDFAPYTNVNDMLDMVTAKELIDQARSEASIVVVYMHAGAEGANAANVTGASEYFFGENRGNPEVFAHAVINDGADLVLASGPHVLRGMQYYKGHLIAYSLGDFACYYNFSTVGTLDLSGILRVTLNASGDLVRAQFVSLVLSAAGQPALDPTNASAKFVNQLSTADFGATAAMISPSGSLLLPVSVK